MNDVVTREFEALGKKVTVSVGLDSAPLINGVDKIFNLYVAINDGDCVVSFVYDTTLAKAWLVDECCNDILFLLNAIYPDEFYVVDSVLDGDYHWSDNDELTGNDPFSLLNCVVQFLTDFVIKNKDV